MVNTMKKEGYYYYLAYTHTNTGYNTSTPDLYIYFSKEEIVALSGYSFLIPDNSILYTIRSGNYSTGTTAVNTDRIVRSIVGNIQRNVDVYEHIYTTARGTSEQVYQPEVFTEGSESLALLSVSSIILSVTLFFTVLWKMWQIHK